MGYTEYQQVIRDQREGFTSKILKKIEISSLIVYITNNHILGPEVFVTVYLEDVETSWLLISLHDKESFIIKRTGVCVLMTAKTISQNINSRKTVLLQLESSWVVEKLMFFRSLYEKWYLFLQEYLRMLHKTSTSSKKGEIFRIILQTFFTYY